MRKTFRYRIYPTSGQVTAMQRILDACRWVYNKTIEVRKDAWETKQESLSRYDTNKLLTQWKKDRPWLNDGHAQAMQDAQKRVDLAYRAFFRRVKAGETPGYPRFRDQRFYNSFTYPQPKGNWRFLENGRLRLSKVGNVRIVLHRPIEGIIKTLTIIQNPTGKWYAAFSCELDEQPLAPSPHAVGIDVGLEKFATLSTGEQIPNPRFFRQEEKALAKAQRKLSQLEKGTSEYHKACKIVSRIHERIKFKRTNFVHQLSRRLVNEFQIIVFEDLNIQGMIKNHCLAKSIGDAAWNQLILAAQAKAREAGRTVILVNPRNTSKACSDCGKLVEKTLSDRIHHCPSCNLEIDRDLNAALNILALGLQCIGQNP